MSHLHKDHSGGIAKPDKKSIKFSQCNILCKQAGMGFCFEKGIPSYITEDFLVFKGNTQLQFTEGNGIIDNYIHYEVTGAHIALSPGIFDRRK